MITLSIIIPVYNEEKTIALVLETIFKIQLPTYEIIVVNDGSTDESLKKIKSVKNKLIKIISHKTNLGKGAAVRSGIKVATGDYILIQDADLEYNPEEIPKLIKPIPFPQRQQTGLRSEGVAVYGSRFVNNQAVIPLLYFLGNKFLTFLTNLLYRTKLTDMETGYKLLPASFLKQIKLNSSHFDIEPEITAKLIKKGFKIIEIPISYKGRTHLAGKKLTVKDAVSAIINLLYYRYRS